MPGRFHKPLLPQPEGPPTELAPLSALNAAKRAATFADNEAQQPAAKRLANRTDLDKEGKRIYTLNWLRCMDREMRLWAEFLETQHGREDAVTFFRPGGPLPTLTMLNGYFYWLGQALEGTLASASHEPSTVTETTRPTVRTIHGHLAQLSAAFKYYNRRIPQGLVSSAYYKIENEYARELGLSNEVKQKSTAYPADVDCLVQAIWRFDSLSVFKTIYGMFVATLILNLLVDGASRIGEFISSSDDHPGILWQDIEFWLLPSDNGEPVTVHAVILCKWLKNQTSQAAQHKSFIVRLLPPALVFQDSCRQLVLLGLHLGIFQHFTSWEEIKTCQPSPTGSRLVIKDTFLQDAVFIKRLPRLERLDPQARQKGGLMYQDLSHQVSQLSRLAGLARKTELHLLRRGNAFLLLKHCQDREEARILMGQRGNDGSAFQAYISKTSTTDLQAIARGVDPKDLTLFSGLMLGRSNDAPTTLPESELAQVEQHPKYLEAQRNADAIHTSIIEKYGSLPALRDACSVSEEAVALMRNFTLAKKRNYNVFTRLAELKFRAYREEAVKELTAARPSNASSSSRQSRLNASNTPGTVGEGAPNTIESASTSDEVDVALIQTSVGNLTTSQARNLLDTTDADASDGHIDKTYRKHLVFRSEVNSQVGRVGRQNTLFKSFSPFITQLASIFHELTAGLANDEDEVEDGVVMVRMLSLLESDHFSCDLPDHWVNHANPLLCKVCDQPLEVEKAFKHVYDCLHGQAKHTAESTWQDYLESLPVVCNHVSNGNKKDNSCKKKHLVSAMSPAERHTHFTREHKGGVRAYCGWGSCASMTGLEALHVHHADFSKHLWRSHGLLKSSNLDSLFFFCRWCQEFIHYNVYSVERETHLQQHLATALDQVRQFGYRGVHISQRSFVPPFCCFCLHNEQLISCDRLPALTGLFHSASDKIALHLHYHFQTMNAYDKLACPCMRAGMCDYKATMTPRQLWEHISLVHYAVQFNDQKYGPEQPGRDKRGAGKKEVSRISKYFKMAKAGNDED